MPTESSTNRVHPRPLRLWARLEAYFERESARRARPQLSRMGDHLLKDIGLTRADLLDFGR